MHEHEIDRQLSLAGMPDFDAGLIGIQVRACSAATMVIGRPGGAWWHPGSQTPCEHEGEPLQVRWVSGGIPLEPTEEMVAVFEDAALLDGERLGITNGLRAVLAMLPRSGNADAIRKAIVDVLPEKVHISRATAGRLAEHVVYVLGARGELIP